ncbi:DUF7173 family protein [Endozoicomonas euniceicola]|uniref:Uncharacterized protein n=1 Tax=Endozoicomonas euniceicola TaxID=1234143 RepID=A0ABY6GTW2_9GAMM|nr:hypothetical protein [Endozoicomonas euniceicola]UYM16222.1 hypothetical protein NX720_26070 [Endozoicomonas euniceicola]
MSNNASRLDQLAYQLEIAKENELSAKNHRIAIEEEICLLAGVKPEGSLSVNGEYYKVTTVAGFTRSLDTNKWLKVKDRVPAHIANKIIRQKMELDTKQLKNLQDLDPAHYNIVAEAITTKPKKTSVRFQRLEDQ